MRLWARETESNQKAIRCNQRTVRRVYQQKRTEQSSYTPDVMLFSLSPVDAGLTLPEAYADAQRQPTVLYKHGRTDLLLCAELQI